jgi:hypothetical protein
MVVVVQPKLPLARRAPVPVRKNGAANTYLSTARALIHLAIPTKPKGPPPLSRTCINRPEDTPYTSALF